ncbi:hypothetical protein CHELA40_13083 [Chelatococcus asaccharovorans]|nr:hypothetical protein CHELA40_13083 [Chelatococcus asaccharovorans]CAH1680432.1 hypothetical protein CHELA17_62537 [Chelatococcus asaccharovorans]
MYICFPWRTPAVNCVDRSVFAFSNKRKPYRSILLRNSEGIPSGVISGLSRSAVGPDAQEAPCQTDSLPGSPLEAAVPSPYRSMGPIRKPSQAFRPDAASASR